MRCFFILLANTFSFAASFQFRAKSLNVIPSHSPPLLRAVENKPKGLVPPVFSEVCEETGVTLSRYMIEVARNYPELSDLETLMNGLQTATKTISNLVSRASISGLVGLEGGGGSINIQGEEQKRLDVITNDVLKKALRFTGKLGVLASEEEDKPVAILQNDRSQSGAIPKAQYKSDVLIDEGSRYVAVFDPLDGSSNLDAGIPTGTIFGIYEESDECILDLSSDDSILQSSEENCLVNTLQPGKNLVAAGYCLYSSATYLAITLGAGVDIFTLDTQIGEFILTHNNVQIPKRGSIYSFNEGNRWEWDKPLQEYVTALQTGQGQSGTKYKSRYIGSMVADVHRTLLYGGIFGYPADTNNPDGKLRLLYEAAPMAFLMEEAGGLALTGKTRIMDLPPKSVHQRVPCILGSEDDVLEMRSFYEASDDPELIKRCLDRLNTDKV